jgi:hypothetical protein
MLGMGYHTFMSRNAVNTIFREIKVIAVIKNFILIPDVTSRDIFLETSADI